VKHGIKIIEKATGEVVEFIPCRTGREALIVLSGVRRNMSPDFKAEEGFIEEKENEKIQNDGGH